MLIGSVSFVQCSSKSIVGLKRKVSFSNGELSTLWRNFRARVPEIKHRVDQNCLSLKFLTAPEYLQIHPYFEFEQWAAAQVSNIDDLPEGMNSFQTEEGSFAQFIHCGTSIDFRTTITTVLMDILPKFDYQLRDGSYFEVLGPEYNPFDPQAQETVFLPVKAKT